MVLTRLDNDFGDPDDRLTCSVCGRGPDVIYSTEPEPSLATDRDFFCPHHMLLKLLEFYVALGRLMGNDESRGQLVRDERDRRDS